MIGSIDFPCDHIRRPRRRKATIFVIAALAMVSVHALAQETVVVIDIPPQTLGNALKEFAEQAKVNILFTPSADSEAPVEGISGNYTLAQILDVLLNKSQLIYEFTDSKTVLITLYNAQSVSGEDSTEVSEHSVNHSGTNLDKTQWSARSRTLLDEVIVSAQKREQILQKVPMSVTAITEAFLSDAGIDNLTDYARRVPGLSYTDFGPIGARGQRGVNLRGVVPTAGPASVGFYIGETPVAFNNPRLFDVNRIEVLRGPQGTLYGRNSMGGTVKIIPNKPNSDEFKANVDATVSYTENGGVNYLANAMVNIPLVKDILAVRIVAFERNVEGFIDNISVDPAITPTTPTFEMDLLGQESNHNDENTYGFRAAVEFKLSKRLTITPSVFFQKTNIGGPPWFFDDLQDLQSQFFIDPKGAEDFTLSSLEMAYDLGGVQFISSTSYYDRSQSATEDLTELVDATITGIGATLMLPLTTDLFPTPAQVGGATKQFVQEVRFSSSNDSPFQWLVGGFYSDADQTSLFHSQPAGIANVVASPLILPNDLIFSGTARGGAEEVAVFGELSYEFFGDLIFTSGLRWFDIRFDSSANIDGFLNGGLSTNDISGGDKGLTPRFNLSYQATDDFLIYANAAKGFRQGVANTSIPASVCAADLAALGLTSAPNQSESDSLWSYEVGAKTGWLGNRLVVNGAAFYIDWSEAQQLIILPMCNFSFTDNVGETSSKGFELEVAAKLVDGLDVTVGTSYVDAKLERDAPSVGGVTGDRLLETPRWTLAASANYRFPINDKLSGFARAYYSYTGGKKTSFVDPTLDRPPYDITDIRVGVSGDNWEASLFAANVLDERPQWGRNAFGVVGRARITTAQPRTWGVNVKKSF